MMRDTKKYDDSGTVLVGLEWHELTRRIESRSAPRTLVCLLTVGFVESIVSHPRFSTGPRAQCLDATAMAVPDVHTVISPRATEVTFPVTMASSDVRVARSRAPTARFNRQNGSATSAPTGYLTMGFGSI